ncbi:hypothetical protein YC2023_108739 [Brassica napus]
MGDFPNSFINIKLLTKIFILKLRWGKPPYSLKRARHAHKAEVYGQGLAILVPRRLVQEKNTSGSKEDGVKSLAPSGDEERRGL